MSNEHELCDERYKNINMMIKYLIAGVICSFCSIGGLYLYAANSYIRKDLYDQNIIDIKISQRETRKEIQELRKEFRQEMQDGFDRLEKQINDKR